MNGKKLVVSDLSNIEGRGLAWLAGEQWKLEAFRAYDVGKGPDVYNLTATGIIGQDPYNISKKDRNVFGKVPDLALGYEGGVGALQTFTRAYGIKMMDHWDTIQQNIAYDHIIKARENLDAWGRARMFNDDISEDEWIASETVKLVWRARHPATRKLWYAVKEAAVGALKNPGTVFVAGPHLRLCAIKHQSGFWLLVKLPSGRYLTYYDARLTHDDTISYMGYGTENGEQGARIWTRIYTYGGKIVENATQALAGDILKAAMPGIEAAGYAINLTVHDEVVTEVPDTVLYNADVLSTLLSKPPAWAPDLPLAAAGFEDYRYKKED